MGFKENPVTTSKGYRILIERNINYKKGVPSGAPFTFM